MKLIIDVPDEIVKKGFEGPLSDEERQILIRAIGNGTSYEEPQGDSISRENLKEQIKTEIANVPKPDTDTDYYVGVEQGLKLAKVIIDNAPTVETEITNDDLQAAMTESYRLGYELAETKFKRPQGEWVLQYRSCGEVYYTCSLCNRAIEVENGQSLKDFPFCHCGAKMRGIE